MDFPIHIQTQLQEIGLSPIEQTALHALLAACTREKVSTAIVVGKVPVEGGTAQSFYFFEGDLVQLLIQFNCSALEAAKAAEGDSFDEETFFHNSCNVWMTLEQAWTDMLLRMAPNAYKRLEEGRGSHLRIATPESMKEDGGVGGA